MSVPSAVSLVHGKGPRLYAVEVWERGTLYARGLSDFGARATIAKAEGLPFEAMLSAKLVDVNAEVPR